MLYAELVRVARTKMASWEAEVPCVPEPTTPKDARTEAPRDESDVKVVGKCMRLFNTTAEDKVPHGADGDKESGDKDSLPSEADVPVANPPDVPVANPTLPDDPKPAKPDDPKPAEPDDPEFLATLKVATDEAISRLEIRVFPGPF